MAYKAEVQEILQLPYNEWSFQIGIDPDEVEVLSNSRMLLCGMLIGSWVLGLVRSVFSFLSGKEICSRILQKLLICSRIFRGILLCSRMLCGVLGPSGLIGESILLRTVCQVSVFCLWIFTGAAGRVRV